MVLMALNSIALNLRSYNNLAVTMITVMMMGHDWVMVVVMAMIGRKSEFVNISAFHGWAMIVITTMIFRVIYYRRLHGLAVMFVTVMIRHYGQVVIIFMAVMLHAVSQILIKELHDRSRWWVTVGSWSSSWP